MSAGHVKNNNVYAAGMATSEVSVIWKYRNNTEMRMKRMD